MIDQQIVGGSEW